MSRTRCNGLEHARQRVAVLTRRALLADDLPHSANEKTPGITQGRISRLLEPDDFPPKGWRGRGGWDWRIAALLEKAKIVDAGALDVAASAFGAAESACEARKTHHGRRNGDKGAVAVMVGCDAI